MIFCNRMNVNKSQMVPPLTFFGTMRLFKFLIFLEKFLNVSKRSPFTFFDILQQIGSSKIPRIPFSNFRHCEIFQNHHFSSKIRFYQQAISEFCFFLRLAFSPCIFSKLLVSPAENGPQFFITNKYPFIGKINQF